MLRGYIRVLQGRAADLASRGGAMRDREALARWERFADSELSTAPRGRDE